ncbi:MAG: acyl-CoA dehydrogenase family protein [Gracilibacteraceae bacterium]|nr:acyl-CoA dehydrogenase family protein [Gracilibacteraceae bacterium]
MFNLNLAPEQVAIQQKTRAFVDSCVIPQVKEFDEKGEFPTPIIDEARQQGYLQTCVPAEYGGPGYDALTIGLITEELGRGCIGVATCLGGNGLSSYPVLLGGSDELKKAWFQFLTDGKLGAFALTEPGAGSDAAAVATRAVAAGDCYVLNGSKCFITTGAYASVFCIIASTDPSLGTKGLSAFYVEAGTPGLKIGKHENKLGLRASNTVELILNDLRVPKSQLIGREGIGFKLAMGGLDSGRINQAAMAVGLAQRALEEVVQFTRTETRNGKPLSRSQDIQFKVADMATQVAAARNMYYWAAFLKDSHQPFSQAAAMAKLFCTDTATQVACLAVEIFGLYGFMKESPVEKLMRDVKVMQIYEGTNQIQRIVIGGATLAGT